MDTSQEEDRSVIAVSVEGDVGDWERFAQLAQSAQNRFRFIQGEPGEVQVRISNKPARSLFAAERVEGVSVSAWQVEDICRRAKLEREAFLLVGGLVGLTCWRTIRLNSLLVSEDLWHREAGRCLFSLPTGREHYALVFEDPLICAGCREFFRCLGVEPEVVALQKALDFLFPLKARLGQLHLFAAPGAAATPAISGLASRN